MASYQEAAYVKFLYQNLNVNIVATIVVNGEEVLNDQGPNADHQLHLRTPTGKLNPVNPSLILTTLNGDHSTNEADVKFLASLGDVMEAEIEGVLSNFTAMKQMRAAQYSIWKNVGRPDSHIYRS